MKIKNCPFCGSLPNFPEAKYVYGTFYDAGCEDCCLPQISYQIIDFFYFDSVPSRTDAHDSWDEKNKKYGDKFINIARDNAIIDWNKRTEKK